MSSPSISVGDRVRALVPIAGQFKQIGKVVRIKLDESFQVVFHVDFASGKYSLYINHIELITVTRIDLEEGKNSYLLLYDLPEELCLDQTGFEDLWKLKPEKKDHGKMFGKEMEFPRYAQMFGQSNYRFAGTDHQTKPIEHPFLAKLLDHVQCMECDPDSYKDMLVNFYPDGDHYIGAHSDREEQMIKGMPIWSFSYGQERKFVIQAKKGSFKKEIQLKPNTAVVMCGDMQLHYKHSVPKAKNAGARTNVTVRPMCRKRKLEHTLSSSNKKSKH